MPPRVLVLYNEPVLPADHPDAGSEHDILDTVADTFKVLKAAGFDAASSASTTTPARSSTSSKTRPPDAVFNLFEGIATQPATEVSAAALLEWLNVPFTGCPSPRPGPRPRQGPRPSTCSPPPGCRPRTTWWSTTPRCRGGAAVAGDRQAGRARTPASASTRAASSPRRSSSTTACEYVLATYGPPVLVEQFVAGREFHVNIIEERPPPACRLVLPLAEIAFDTTARAAGRCTRSPPSGTRTATSTSAAPLVAPVELPPDELRRGSARSPTRPSALLECRDYARLDVRMDADGEFYVLEMNPNPYLNSLALVNGLEAVGRTPRAVHRGHGPGRHRPRREGRPRRDASASRPASATPSSTAADHPTTRHP